MLEVKTVWPGAGHDGMWVLIQGRLQDEGLRRRDMQARLDGPRRGLCGGANGSDCAGRIRGKRVGMQLEPGSEWMASRAMSRFLET